MILGCEIALELLKEVWSVETGFEVRFEGANEKLHVHAILGLGKKKDPPCDGLATFSR